MPRIDPLSLLKCLSVLLGSTGGIKSKEEVHRLANLMTKFSKKLVSKCIYIQILKTTDTDLLSQFMGAGGWNLVHMWLTDGILAKNWALIQELLELLLLCPVDIERLKSNNCPKLIKGLSKEGSHQGVRILASRLVEQWLKIVKGEAAPNSVPAQIMTGSGTFKACPIPTAIVHPRPSSVISTTQIINSSCSSTSNNNSNSSSLSEKIETDKNTQFAQSNCCLVVEEEQESKAEDPPNETSFQLISEKALQLSTDVNKPAQCQQQKKSFVVVPGSQASMMVPVYKITIRDGKQVLTKVDTDASNVNINLPGSEVNGDIAAEDIASIENSQEVVSDSQSQLTDKSDNKEEVTVSNSSNSQNVIEETTLDSSKDIAETTDVKIKDKDKQSVSADKSTNDKENRDSSKKDEKKNSTSVITPNSSTTTDKKSSHHSSKSSSKHSSSSSSHRSSNSHRSSSSSLSHRSNSKSTTSKDKTKDKEKHHSSSKHSSNSKSRSDRDKEKEKEKERLKKDQAEKDKATLEKVQGPALTSKLGKIPKKKTEDDKSNDIGSKRSSTDSKESKVKDTKKAVAVSSEKKNISISIENRKSSQDSLTRPKTVKTFNSKFRSTGLEEEAKPPPPRSVKKSNSVIDKQKLLPSKVSSLKRSSPIRESGSSSDKRARLSIENSVATTSEEKKGGSKLIPPKPKPTILQESDMFMDALTAASTKNKEPRKRKRRTSISKESGPETKKLDTSSSEQNRDTSPPLISPSATSNASQKSEDKALVKPNFKFYQDTLETDEDKEEAKGKTKSEGVGSKTKAENGEEEAEDERDEEEDDDEDDDDEEHKKNKNSKDANQEEDEDDEDRSTTPTPAEESFGEKMDSNQDNAESSQNEIRYVEGLRSVLILQKRKGPKKSLKWKVELESIRYFELDETERVNVTKTFSDMKQIEKQNERDAFQMARKLSTEDLMEEKTRWRALIPIDVPPALVEPGKDSREKDIQYAREKGILQALYFHRSMIPDTPAEPEEERLLPVIDAKVIPLDDLTGTKANEKDFTTIPWPDPKPQLPNPQTPPVTMNNFPYQAYPPNNQHPMLPSMGPPQQTPMGPMPPIPQPMMNPMNQMGPDMVSVPPGGGWRTGDGKVVVPDMPGMNPMSNVPGGYPPQGMDGQMVPPPPGMMGPPMYNQPDGFMLPPDDMGYNNVPNNFQGPPGPVMFGPGPGPNFQGGPRGGGPGPMHVNRGRGAPPGAGWFRGGPPVRGVGWRGGWRGNAKQPPVCRQFSKTGYCRAENKCQFLHPGVNCPPF